MTYTAKWRGLSSYHIEQVGAVQQVYDQLAPIYDQSFQTPIALAENAYIFRQLSHLLSEESVILDVGCGTGLLLEYLPVPPRQYVGLDISPGMLAIAHQKFPQHIFMEADMHTLTTHAGAGRYDAVISLFNAFMYAVKPLVVLQQMYAALKPGGMLFLMTASLRYASRPSYILNREQKKLATHTLLPSFLLREQARGAGFEQIHVRGFHASAEQLFSKASQRFLEHYLALEAALIGRLRPDACYFHLLSARKPLESWY